jgi:hypothetical protein
MGAGCDVGAYELRVKLATSRLTAARFVDLAVAYSEAATRLEL